MMTKNQTKKRVALGMSGGVDSSICAHLLTEKGYEVTGVFMECWRAPGCRTDADRADALKVALSLGIKFEVLDFKQAYHDRVVELFFRDYQAGLTPNPDIACNREIKFGLFYDWAMAEGFDFVATGHYAAISEDGQLAIPADTHKDQTYFLYPLREEQLKHTLFPLANFKKQEVRELAAQKKLHNTAKKDSVGICFIGDINVHDFLRERLGENPGPVVNQEGVVIGSHQGLWFYTIGQRSGFTIDKKTVYQLDDGQTITRENIPPFYVVDKKPDQNQLVVGFGAGATSSTFAVEDLHLIAGQDQDYLSKLASAGQNQLLVRIRHTGALTPVASFERGQVTTSEPLFGLATGQAAVFYQQRLADTICLGGGVIKT